MTHKDIPDLWNGYVLSRDSSGGKTMLVLGIPRSGKTSLLLGIAETMLKTIQQHELDEYSWFIGDSMCQWANIGLDKCHILVKEGINRVFTVNGKIHPINDEVQYFDTPIDLSFNSDTDERARSPMLRNLVMKDFNELLSKARKDKLNVVYMNDDDWNSFFVALPSISFSWHSFYIDEAQRLVPLNPPGEQYYRNKHFIYALQEAGKCRHCFYLTTHSETSLDYDISEKIVIRAFLYGLYQAKNTRVWSKTLASIKLGYAIISVGGYWRKIQFSPYRQLIDLRSNYLVKQVITR